MLKGIAASSGIAIAKVYKLQQPVLNIEKKECDSAAEVAKFQAALVKTQADIEAVKAKAEATPPAVRTENGLFRKNIVWNPFVFLCALNFTMFRNRTVTADRNPRRIAAASGKAPRLIPDCKQNSYK